MYLMSYVLWIPSVSATGGTGPRIHVWTKPLRGSFSSQGVAAPVSGVRADAGASPSRRSLSATAILVCAA